MTNTWAYKNPVDVHFGIGVRSYLANYIKNKRCLIVTSSRGRQQFSTDNAFNDFINQNEILWVDSISPNPCITELQGISHSLQNKSIDAIIGFGGGSAIDGAKALSVILAPALQDQDLKTLLSNPKQFESASLIDLYAFPTTSGTGSEVTPFATIWDHVNRKKHSLAGSNLFPKAAFVDPELSKELPIGPTINTGLDAVNQAAESIWNNNATPITLAYAYRAIALGFEALPKLAEGSHDLELRSKMAECSLLAGLAISNTRTALCHSISYPLTAHFGVPHGLACAFTMPAVLKLNLKTKDARFEVLKQVLNSSNLEETFSKLNEQLKVREQVRSYVGDLSKLLSLTNEMMTPGRAGNNLSPANQINIEGIITAAWG